MNKEKMAFAKSGAVDPCGNQLSVEQTGMTLREYYAGQALAAMISAGSNWYEEKATAKIAIKHADALKAELEGGE